MSGLSKVCCGSDGLAAPEQVVGFGISHYLKKDNRTGQGSAVAADAAAWRSGQIRRFILMRVLVNRRRGFGPWAGLP
jgi:hypothetical protein